MTNTAVMPITVHVRENARYMDERAAYDLGPFASHADAAAVCRKIVDDFLTAHRRPDLDAEAFFGLYAASGEDPSIVGGRATDAPFSAWDYARERCRALSQG